MIVWDDERPPTPAPPTWRDLVLGSVVVAAYLLLLGQWLVSDTRVVNQAIARVVWGE